MDSRLNAFLERAESVLARIEPLLPAPRPVIDGGTCLAARWQRDGRSGYLLYGVLGFVLIHFVAVTQQVLSPRLA